MKSTIANSAIVQPDATGGVCVVASKATDLVLDATGWFDDGFVALPEPRRLFDSRGGQAGALERWLRQVMRDHPESILPVDYRVAEQWGRLTAMRSGSVIDTLMAATAQVFDLVLVTRNVKHVAWSGVSYLNPFDPARAH